jgi:replicative DNA helicase
MVNNIQSNNSNVTSLRDKLLPPHDISAEQAIIAALFLDEESYIKIISIIESSDFFDEKNKWIFESIIAVATRNEKITIPAVSHELERLGKIDAVGGERTLVDISNKFFTAIGIETHARIVARDSVYRKIIQVSSEIAQRAYEGGPDAKEVLTYAEGLLLSIKSSDFTGDFTVIKSLLNKFLEDMDSDSEGELYDSVRTGFMDLDQLCGGFKRGDLIILAARTGVGKSALLLNFARNAGIGQGATVAIFSLEMSGEQLATRLLSAEANVGASKLKFGLHSETEEARIMHSIGTLGESLIFIDDSPMLGVPEIRAKLKRLQSDHGLDLVIVDYLQLLHGTKRTESRTSEISEITRSLKELARELNIPVIAAAQLSRAVEQRTPHIPMLSDLRESGSIEQDADLVLFIYREDVYTKFKDWQEKNIEKPDDQFPSNLAQLILAKHRNGPTGNVTVRFNAETATFHDLILREQ